MGIIADYRPDSRPRVGGYFPLSQTSAAGAPEYLPRVAVSRLLRRAGHLYLAGQTGAGRRVASHPMGIYPLDMLCINPHGYAPHP